METTLWNGKMGRGRGFFFQVILGQLRNFGGFGHESGIFHSLDLLRLCQLVEHLTLESTGAPAPFTGPFSPPGDSEEQNKSRGTAPAVIRDSATLLQPQHPGSQGCSGQPASPCTPKQGWAQLQVTPTEVPGLGTTWLLLHVESAGRHLGRRKRNPIVDLLQQNTRKE